MQIMMRFSCDELRVKRARANSNIAADQRDKQRIEAEIRHREIRIANLRAEISRIQRRPLEPALPGPADRSDNRRRKKPGWAAAVEVVIDGVQASAPSILNRSEIREIEAETRELDADLPRLRSELRNRQDRLNESISARGCINQATRAKGCVGA
ncbi:MAG: hypothetical protein ACFE0P_08515 [Oceanicaulis sp.]